MRFHPRLAYVEAFQDSGRLPLQVIRPNVGGKIASDNPSAAAISSADQAPARVTSARDQDLWRETSWFHGDLLPSGSSRSLDSTEAHQADSMATPRTDP